jgi:hypothetical protein
MGQELAAAGSGGNLLFHVEQISRHLTLMPADDTAIYHEAMPRRAKGGEFRMQRGHDELYCLCPHFANEFDQTVTVQFGGRIIQQ